MSCSALPEEGLFLPPLILGWKQLFLTILYSSGLPLIPLARITFLLHCQPISGKENGLKLISLR